MFSVPQLLDRAKVAAGIESDYALAKITGLGKANISNYRNEKTAPDERAIVRLCEISGDDPVEVAIEINSSRAANDDAIDLWKRIGARLQKGFASISTLAVIALISIALDTTPGQAALSYVSAGAASSVYYVKWLSLVSLAYRLIALCVNARNPQFVTEQLRPDHPGQGK